MASAAKSMSRFGGQDTEGVIIWLRDCSLVAKKTMLTEELTLRVMILALDRNARSWTSQAHKRKITTHTEFTK